MTHLVLYGAYARGRMKRDLPPQAIEEAEMLLSLISVGWGRPNAAAHKLGPYWAPEAHEAKGA